MSFAERLDRGLDSFDRDGGRCPAPPCALLQHMHMRAGGMEHPRWIALGENERTRKACLIGYQAQLRHHPKILDFLCVPKHKDSFKFERRRVWGKFERRRLSELDDMQHVSPYAGLSSQPPTRFYAEPASRSLARGELGLDWAPWRRDMRCLRYIGRQNSSHHRKARMLGSTTGNVRFARVGGIGADAVGRPLAMIPVQLSFGRTVASVSCLMPPPSGL
jgi:hypothetical protein